MQENKRYHNKISGRNPRERVYPNGEEIGKRLKYVINKQRRCSQKMYGKTEEELDKSLTVLIKKKREEMARKLIHGMGCSPEIVTDLTVLALYDVVSLIRMPRCECLFIGVILLIVGRMDNLDDSDSMIYEEKDAKKKTLRSLSTTSLKSVQWQMNPVSLL